MKSNPYLDDLKRRLDSSAEAEFAPLFPVAPLEASRVKRLVEAARAVRSERSFVQAFKVMALSAAAAVILLLAVTWATEDTISIDAIAGISSLSWEDATAMESF